MYTYTCTCTHILAQVYVHTHTEVVITMRVCGEFFSQIVQIKIPTPDILSFQVSLWSDMQFWLVKGNCYNKLWHTYTGSWCSRDNGETYTGSNIFTESDEICQEWNSRSPHPHPTYLPSEIHNARRQCRNPGGRGERPWCYTTSTSRRWEYCNVPQCSKYDMSLQLLKLSSPGHAWKDKPLLH